MDNYKIYKNDNTLLCSIFYNEDETLWRIFWTDDNKKLVKFSGDLKELLTIVYSCILNSDTEE